LGGEKDRVPEGLVSREILPFRGGALSWGGFKEKEAEDQGCIGNCGPAGGWSSINGGRYQKKELRQRGTEKKLKKETPEKKDSYSPCSRARCRSRKTTERLLESGEKNLKKKEGKKKGNREKESSMSRERDYSSGKN